MPATNRYDAFAAAFVRGRSLQRGCLPGTEASGLPIHYFKRVPLLPRIQWALGVLHSLQPVELLDIGSGRGKFLWPLLDTFPALPVTAVDVDPRRVRDLEAVHLGGIDRLAVREADAVHLPFPAGAFDVVTLLEVLEHIRTPAPAVAEAVRVARRAVLLSAPSRPDDNPEHLHLFSADDLRGLLLAGGAAEVKIQQAPGHWLVLAHVTR